MEDTRVFDHTYNSWSCDVCKSDVFNNSCGCIEYTDFCLNRRIEHLGLQELGRLVYNNPALLEFVKADVEVGHAVWSLDRRVRMTDEAYKKWEPFEDQYYDGSDDGF